MFRFRRKRGRLRLRGVTLLLLVASFLLRRKARRGKVQVKPFRGASPLRLSRGMYLSQLIGIVWFPGQNFLVVVTRLLMTFGTGGGRRRRSWWVKPLLPIGLTQKFTLIVRRGLKRLLAGFRKFLRFRSRWFAFPFLTVVTVVRLLFPTLAVLLFIKLIKVQLVRSFL